MLVEKSSISPEEHYVQNFLQSCDQKMNKKQIEDIANDTIRQNDAYLLLLQENISKEMSRSIPTHRGMNILYILNKIFSRYVETNQSNQFLSWQKVIDDFLPVFVTGLSDEKNLRHLDRILKIWSKDSCFDKETTQRWSKYVEDSIATISRKDDGEGNITPLPPPPPPLLESSTAGQNKTPTSTISTTSHRNKENIDQRISLKRPIHEIEVSNNAPAHENYMNDLHNFFNQNSYSGTTSSSISPAEEWKSRNFLVVARFIKQIFTRYILSNVNKSLPPSKLEIDHMQFDNSNANILNLKLVMLSAFWLLQEMYAFLQDDDDILALGIACIYLAGKVEYFFIDLARLKTTAESQKHQFFSSENTLPADDTVFHYEMELLKMINFDVNLVDNPIKVLRAWRDERLIDDIVFQRVTNSFCSDQFLLDIYCWQYHPRDAVLCLHVLLHLDIGKRPREMYLPALREKMKKIFKSKLFQHLREKTSFLSYLKYYKKKLVERSVEKSLPATGLLSAEKSQTHSADLTSNPVSLASDFQISFFDFCELAIDLYGKFSEKNVAQEKQTLLEEIGELRDRGLLPAPASSTSSTISPEHYTEVRAEQTEEIQENTAERDDSPLLRAVESSFTQEETETAENKEVSEVTS